MGYPPQPQDPYQPQQPYGQSGPQPQHGYGYGYQPPTSPPPPKRNTGLIILLAVGLPLLLLGGCGAVVLVLASSGNEVVTEADPPLAASRQPEASAPPAQETAEDQPVEQQSEPASDQSSTATVGGAITLRGNDPGLQVKATLTKVVNPATPDSDFMKPKAGNKFVALEVRLENVGQAVYSDAPVNGATLIDGEGQQFNTSLFRVQEGQSLNGSVTINAGDVRKGMIVFEVPEGAKLAKFQFALNSGFADQKGEWTLS